MTIILHSDYYVNESGTLLVEQYQDKGCVPLWRVVYSYGIGHPFQMLKNGLLRKPCKRQIERYLDSL